MGGSLCLLFNSGRVLTPIVGIISLSSLRSRHNMPPNFLGGKFMNIRCPPYKLQVFLKTHLEKAKRGPMRDPKTR
jgi:hypothetical protein